MIVMRKYLLLLPILLLIGTGCDSDKESYVQKIDFDHTICSSYCDEDGMVNASLLLVKGEVDSNGEPVAPFESLSFDLFFNPEQENDSPHITSGRYVESGADGEPFTAKPFTYRSDDLETARYSTCSSDKEPLFYSVESGSVVVERSGDSYDIKIDVRMDGDWRIRGNIKGAVGFPSPAGK